MNLPLLRRVLQPLLVALVALATPALAVAAEPHFMGDHLVRVHLVAESQKVVRGATTWLAVEFTPSPGWHIYWRNPGDSGAPPTFAWALPRGVTAGAPLWPAPEALDTAGTTTYVHSKRTTLLVPLRIAGDVAPARSFAVAANLAWLVCSNVCVPGRGHISTSVTVAADAAPTTDGNVRAVFSGARSRIPGDLAGVSFSSSATAFELSAPVAAFAGERVSGATFFPFDRTLIAQSAPQRVVVGNRLLLTLARNRDRSNVPTHIDGVLSIDAIAGDGHRERRSFELSARPQSVVSTMAERPLSFLAAFALAFFGGIILNVMPCVFPVLSFKAIGVIQSNVAPKERWIKASAYAAGVVASCSALGLVLLALRGGGHALGWGFQWQSPLFVALLALLMLALALSLSGVAEIVIALPGSLSHGSDGHGNVSAFADGALVALVASSCTAPFMGAALGFALTASAPVGLGVFVALGLGLALPYVVVTGVPAVAARLPKPGPWMIVARRLFAFPLYATVAWLVWVFSAQVDGNGLLALLAALVFVAFGMSAFGSAQASDVWRRGWIALGVAGFMIGLVLVAPVRAVERRGDAKVLAQGELRFEPYSPARLAALRSAGRPVFVDMTAAWCITCQVNDRLALQNSDVGKRFNDLHVTLLQGDWTNQDARISAYLQHFGRSGVPLYVYYDARGKVEVWPQLLTPSLVLERLRS